MTRAVSLTLLYDVFHSILGVILCQHFQKSFIFWKELFPIRTTIYVVFQCYSFIYIIFHKLNFMFTIYVVCSLIISSHFSPYSFLCYLFDFLCNQIRISQCNCVVFANIHKLFTNNCIICFFRLPRAFFATMCPLGSRIARVGVTLSPLQSLPQCCLLPLLFHEKGIAFQPSYFLLTILSRRV